MKFLIPFCLIVFVFSACNSSSSSKSSETDAQGQAAPSETLSRALPAEIGITTRFPDWTPQFPPPANNKDVFELSQDYPTTFNNKEVYAWEKIDFKKQPNDYAMAVIRYCLEGNVEANFKVKNNKVRKWYHAPWLHYGSGGREWMRGMTRERGTPKFEAHAKQDVKLENWAVGVYNEPGGYTLGRIWHTADGKPDPSKALFPRGSVAFKLLFTDAPVEKVPFLAGSFEWQGNIYVDASKKVKRENRNAYYNYIKIIYTNSK